MESLLKWAVLNGANINKATASEDAPARSSTDPAPQPLDPAVLDVILGKPASVQMTECMEAVENPETPLDAREIALDDLEMLVENIDNAQNLEPLNLWPRIIKLFADPEPSIRIGALWVGGTAVQHNPKAQLAFTAHGGLQRALEVLKQDDALVRTKALYCVSSFIRANVQGLTEFIANEGLSVLLKAIENGSSPLRQKTFFLLRSLIDEALDTESPEELRPGMSLPNAIAEMGFVAASAAAIKEMASDENAQAAYEQAVEFLVVLGKIDSGLKAIKACADLSIAVESAKSRFPEVDTKELDQMI
ncbi:hsp70 nucleotide exchange factor fes1 [Coemansia brasiliensis]|uniref:Hsp70 nucleotide exchange factor fes1 n=1 Tax=Coemansia brasiliensis TaxID=2650707 RepID=A0A9W8ICZ5_9FUNG|nr:hsp70 nucleotide exchange factor fes1 [Coemansia brasiliensis]